MGSAWLNASTPPGFSCFAMSSLCPRRRPRPLGSVPSRLTRRSPARLRASPPTPVRTTAPRHERGGRGRRSPTLSATPMPFPHVYRGTANSAYGCRNDTRPRPLIAAPRPPDGRQNPDSASELLTAHHAPLSTGCPPKTSRSDGIRGSAEQNSRSQPFGSQLTTACETATYALRCTDGHCRFAEIPRSTKARNPRSDA